MSIERIQKIKEVLNRRQNDLTVVMDNVHKPQNMAAIARTCDAVGIPEIHIINNYRRHNFLNAKSAAGCKKWINTVSHKNVDSTFKSLRNKGFQILAAHFSDKAKPFREFDYTKPTAIVVGAELDGMSLEAAAASDEHILIPMMGMSQSLNVSVAASLILFEAQRQREEKGMYDYNPENPEIEEFPLEWAFPSVAKKYRARNLEIPKIDEGGNILREKHG